jgi:hypothetical protein
MRMRRRVAAATIHDGVHEHSAAFHHLRRPHERERRDVLNFAACVPRRELDVCDDRVLWIHRVQLSVGFARHPFMCRAGRLDSRDLEFDDIGVRNGSAEHETQREGRCESVDGHGRGPPRWIIA